MSLEFEREDVVQKLCAAYARDQITTGQLEAKLETVYKSQDRAQLLTVLEGLPAMNIARLGEVKGAPTAQGAFNGASARAVTTSGSGTGLQRGEKRYAAIFSSIEKQGAWNPAPKIDARIVAGNILFDFREAAIPAQGIDLDVDVAMGDVKILLPPGLGADVDCSTFMGTVTDKSRPPLPGAPTVRVTGSAFMGSITVITKVPRQEGESSFRKQLKSWIGSSE
jgi:hypothetical protein